jgi:predicted metalloprotease with PDZ domain
VADANRLATDLATVVDAHTARFGGAPYDDYTFLLMLAPGAYGGLEHRASSANLNTPFAMASTSDYGDLLELLSHELFHAWNGKRLVPAGLAPLDYRAEQYTRCLWVIEGLTSYYDRYTLVRSGTMTVARYLEKLCDEWGRLQWTPGRAHHSLEEASFDAWVKLYQRHESNLNSSVSYYLKGGLVVLYMDLEIRRRTAGRVTLDDVVRALWRDYGASGTPYPEEVQPLFEEAAGIELGDLFDRLVRGRDDPDLAGALAAAGLELRATWDSSQTADGADPVWLGITLKSGARIGLVVDGGPAAAAGLSPGDELIAVDGRRVRTEGGLRKRLKLRRPGDRAEIALFRAGRLLTREVALAASPPTRYEIAALEAPSEAQQAFYSAWLGEDHPCADSVIAGATVGRFL